MLNYIYVTFVKNLQQLTYKLRGSSGGLLMRRRLAMLLALSLTFTMLPAGYASAAETVTPEAVEMAVEEENDDAEAVDETIDDAEAGKTAEDEGTTLVEDTTEGQTAEQIEVVPETDTTEAEPADTVVDNEADEADAGSTVINTEVADTEEPEVTETATEAKSMWHGAEYGSNGNVLHFWISGKKVTNKAILIGDKRYGFDQNGNVVTNSWFSYSGKTYYLGADGASLTGWQTIGGKVFYFGVSESDVVITGAMATGKKQIDGKYYLFANENTVPSYTNTQYGKYGMRLTGFRKLGNDAYYLDPATGVMQTGWKTIDGYKYYFGTNGVRRSGFQTVNNKKYYFAAYSFDKSHPGRMVTGISKIGGKYYYLNKYGVLKTGWIVENGVRGWYDSNGAAGKTGWKKKGSEWFYLKANGLAKTGWNKLSSSAIYFLDKTKKGAMVVGPTKLPSGKIVYFDTEGRRATTAGWKGYGEYYYYTNASGVCAVNTTINGIKLDELGRTKMSTMDMKAQGYSSNTNYLVLCDKTTYTVCIYKGSKGNWTRIKGPWRCTHGGSRTPAYTSDGKEKYITFTGRLTKRSATWGWGDFEYTSAAFCMNLSSGNFFHSVLFNKGSRSNPYNLSPVDGQLGTNWSHGCIRLALPNAEWVWDNIPAGTRAVVYNS